LRNRWLPRSSGSFLSRDDSKRLRRLVLSAIQSPATLLKRLDTISVEEFRAFVLAHRFLCGECILKHVGMREEAMADIRADAEGFAGRLRVRMATDPELHKAVLAFADLVPAGESRKVLDGLNETLGGGLVSVELLTDLLRQFGYAANEPQLQLVLLNFSGRDGHYVHPVELELLFAEFSEEGLAQRSELRNARSIARLAYVCGDDAAFERSVTRLFAHMSRQPGIDAELRKALMDILGRHRRATPRGTPAGVQSGVTADEIAELLARYNVPGLRAVDLTAVALACDCDRPAHIQYDQLLSLVHRLGSCGGGWRAVAKDYEDKRWVKLKLMLSRSDPASAGYRSVARRIAWAYDRMNAAAARAKLRRWACYDLDGTVVPDRLVGARRRGAKLG
jgi:hypothetical protein